MMNSKNSCCPENSLPYLPEDPNYQNKGTVVKIPIEGQDQSQTITVYTVGKGRRCVVLIHDIFGLNTGNHKKLCDFIAEKLLDSVVIAPDFFPDGGLWGTSEVDSSSFFFFPKLIWTFITGGFSSYMTNYPWSTRLKPQLDSVISHFVLTQGKTSVGLIGFCWGAYVSCKACGDSNHKKLVKCNISMHPSVSSNAFKESDVDIMNAVNCPQMIYSTPMEPKSWHPEGDISKLLESKVSIAGKNEFGMYNQTHGFVTRGSLDPASPVSKDIGDAIQKSINFFHKNLD